MNTQVQAKPNYNIFIFEAIKITIFCVAIVGLFKLFGAEDKTLLITFNMAVMSCAASFSPERKTPLRVLFGSVVIVLSILCGGLLGFYAPSISKILIIVYAVLAFFIPKTGFKINVFATGAVMFLIFTSLSFDWLHCVVYASYGVVLIFLLMLFYWIFDKSFYKNTSNQSVNEYDSRKRAALIVGIALLGAWLISFLLAKYTDLSHLYWIGLTILVVVQSCQKKAIKTSLVRIAVNTAGAFLIVFLMAYVVPTNFWINLLMLTVFLFLIFALGFSYVGRTLFIELFVLGFTHLLGNFHNVVAFDRVILTLIGGALVILSTLISFLIYKAES